MCCLMCLEWEKGKMTSGEVLGAIGEMLDFSEDDQERAHLFGLVEKVLDSDEESMMEMPELISFEELSLEEDGNE